MLLSINKAPLEGELSPQATEGWKVGCWELFDQIDIFKTFGSHPSDPALPGHLPSRGGLRGVRTCLLGGILCFIGNHILRPSAN